MNPPGSASVLDEILARSRMRVAEERARLPLEALQRAALAAAPARPFVRALARPDRVNVIAEYKRRSPSRGPIREDLAAADAARRYEEAGAVALSILTDEPFFGGRLEHLVEARAATHLPVLRKDFVVDAYQVWQARAAGADAVLLIVAALEDPQLSALLAATREAGLEALVEVHDVREADRAVAAGARVIGVNNRDLRSLAVSLDTSLGLAARLPDDVVAVSESGLRTGGDLRALREAGYDAFLVGEHLMSAPDPGSALRALLHDAEGTA